MTVAQFPGKTVDNHTELARCDCGSYSFKFELKGASRQVTVKCANCETKHTWINVEDFPE